MAWGDYTKHLSLWRVVRPVWNNNPNIATRNRINARRTNWSRGINWAYRATGAILTYAVLNSAVIQPIKDENSYNTILNVPVSITKTTDKNEERDRNVNLHIEYSSRTKTYRVKLDDTYFFSGINSGNRPALYDGIDNIDITAKFKADEIDPENIDGFLTKPDQIKKMSNYRERDCLSPFKKEYNGNTLAMKEKALKNEIISGIELNRSKLEDNVVGYKSENQNPNPSYKNNTKPNTKPLQKDGKLYHRLNYKQQS